MSATAKPRKSKPPKPTARKDDPVNAEHEDRMKAMLRDAMKERGVTPDGLAEALAGIGVRISAGGLANKISRGGFSAAFLSQCMAALDMTLKIEAE